jgi:hypothetical protein
VSVCNDARVADDLFEPRGPQVRLAVGGSPAGAFFVDPERAQACVDALLGVAGDVRASLFNVMMMLFPPPGRDEVSVNMARNAHEMVRRTDAYVRAWANQIEATAEALRQELAAYQRVDEANAARRV